MPEAALDVVTVPVDRDVGAMDRVVDAVEALEVWSSVVAGVALPRWDAVATRSSARIRIQGRTRANLTGECERRAPPVSPLRYLAGSIRSRCSKNTKTTSAIGIADIAQLRRRPNRRVDRPTPSRKTASPTAQKTVGHRCPLSPPRPASRSSWGRTGSAGRVVTPTVPAVAPMVPGVAGRVPEPGLVP